MSLLQGTSIQNPLWGVFRTPISASHVGPTSVRVGAPSRCCAPSLGPLEHHRGGLCFVHRTTRFFRCSSVRDQSLIFYFEVTYNRTLLRSLLYTSNRPKAGHIEEVFVFSALPKRPAVQAFAHLLLRDLDVLHSHPWF